jgi:hypothetical protein
MKLPDPLTVDSLETAYAAWDPQADPTLQLPISLPAPLPFCVEAPLLQLIASAARRAEENLSVQLLGLERRDESFTAALTCALGNTHALCAVVMAGKVLDENGESIPKQDTHVFSRYLDAMDSYEFLETHASAQIRVNLVCVQGARREFIQPLYHEVNGKMVVRPYPDVRLFVQDIVSQLASTWTAKALREVSAPLAQLVKELMENADWWARTDEEGTPYRKGKSFRVLSFRLIEIDDDNAALFGGSNHHLHSYLQTILLEQGTPDAGATSSRKRTINRNTFIELSVVDSGPGLARRWMASREHDKRVIKNLEEISLEDEERAVAECFQKWASSSHNSLRGIGLFSVARMLRERNGFMRMRTGRLAYLFGTSSAVKDVEQKVKGIGQPGQQMHHALPDRTQVFMEGEEVAFFLRPWNEAALSALEGTSYSILLPV